MMLLQRCSRVEPEFECHRMGAARALLRRGGVPRMTPEELRESLPRPCGTPESVPPWSEDLSACSQSQRFTLIDVDVPERLRRRTSGFEGH